jgi:hypothetical protein
MVADSKGGSAGSSDNKSTAAGKNNASSQQDAPSATSSSVGGSASWNCKTLGNLSSPGASTDAALRSRQVSEVVREIPAFVSEWSDEELTLRFKHLGVVDVAGRSS